MATTRSQLRGGQVIDAKIEAGNPYQVRATGRYIHVIDSPAILRIRINGGGWADLGVGAGIGSEDEFDGFEIVNRTAAEISVRVYVGFLEYKDSRQLTTQTDPNFATPVSVTSDVELIANGAAQLLLAADNNRGEVWLWTDEPANLAWWAESAARLAAPQDFQKIGMNLDGFTKLKTKAAIYVYALAGVKIGAVVFKS